MNTAKAATPREQLINELLDPSTPKSEREHAAAIEIERLRDSIRQLYNSYMEVSLHVRICDSSLPFYIRQAAELVLSPQSKGVR